MVKDLKPMLNTDGQIEHLKSKGVKFNNITINEARDYLRESNNYFKLRAYRKNFKKYQNGEKKDKYIDLDFAMLKDLSIIDMRLRYILIHMTLDIEHFVKVKLLRAIEESDNDGYQIVQDYMSMLEDEDKKKQTNRYHSLLHELERNRKNPYCGGIIKKYDENYPVWVFVEIIPFGSLIHFYGYCSDQLKQKEMKNDFFLLLAIKELRNAAAHSNCILNDMISKDSEHNTNYDVINALHNIPKRTRNNHLKNERMRQIVTALYAHTYFVTSKGVKDRVKYELERFTVRMYKHIDYYQKNSTISSTFDFLKKTIDILY